MRLHTVTNEKWHKITHKKSLTTISQIRVATVPVPHTSTRKAISTNATWQRLDWNKAETKMLWLPGDCTPGLSRETKSTGHIKVAYGSACPYVWHSSIPLRPKPSSLCLSRFLRSFQVEKLSTLNRICCWSSAVRPPLLRFDLTEKELDALLCSESRFEGGICRPCLQSGQQMRLHSNQVPHSRLRQPYGPEFPRPFLLSLHGQNQGQIVWRTCVHPQLLHVKGSAGCPPCEAKSIVEPWSRWWSKS